MKFLCLHGSGTNSRIMTSQTGALRHELGEGYEYEFVEATIKAPIAKEVEALSAPTYDLGYAFYDPKDASTLQTALNQLDGYISSEGPFDAVMGFSAGAVLAAMYILQKQERSAAVPFRCAVFLSSADCAAEKRSLGFDRDNMDLIHIPTAHSWGLHDSIASRGGEDLSRMCDPNSRQTLIHQGGHELPRGEQLVEFAHVIRRTMRSARTHAQPYFTGSLLSDRGACMRTGNLQWGLKMERE